MRKKYFIGCKIIKNQVEKIIKKHNLNDECIFLEEQLHNTPDLLRKELKSAINAIENVIEIVIGHGRCENVL